jgi:hypothetical protein
MNMDGLHQRAGDVDALELHGSVLRVRCTVCGSDSPPALLSFAGKEASPPSDTVMRAARFTGARTVGVNPSKDADPGYTEFHRGRAEVAPRMSCQSC